MERQHVHSGCRAPKGVVVAISVCHVGEKTTYREGQSPAKAVLGEAMLICIAHGDSQ